MNEERWVERWSCLYHLTESMLSRDFYRDHLVEVARFRFEQEMPGYEILEVEPIQLVRPWPPFDWTTFEDADGSIHTYRTASSARIVFKVVKR